MAMSITININLDESGTYSPAEAAVIEALAKDVASPATAAAPAAPAPAAAPKAAPKAAPAPKAEKPAPQAAAEAAAEDTGQAAVLEEIPDDQAIAEMEAGLAEGPTVGDAVTEATKLISAGQQAKVKEALAGCGVKRVSELKGDSIAAFLIALAG